MIGADYDGNELISPLDHVLKGFKEIKSLAI